MSEDLKVHAIIVGVNADGGDMITLSADRVSDEDGGDEEKDIIEDGEPCPPMCPPDSPLYP